MAQSQILTRRAQVAVIEETSQDTYLVQTAASVLLAENIVWTPSIEYYRPKYARADNIKMDPIPGKKSGTISFDVLVHGGGAAGTAPKFGEALKACGLLSTNSVGVSETYTPANTYDGAGGNPGASYSVSFLENGNRYSILGAFGNVVLNCTVGEPAKLSFKFTGAWNAITADALETAVYLAIIPPAFQGATFATNIGGAHVPIIETFSFDFGAQVALGVDANKTNGHYGARITDRAPTGSFDPEASLVSTKDYDSIAAAGTSGTIATGDIGGTAGNTWSLSIARAVLTDPSHGDRNGVRTHQLSFDATGLSTDVEGTNDVFTLTFK